MQNLSAMSVSCVKACGCCSAKGLLTAQHLLICFVSDAKVIRRYAKTRLIIIIFQVHASYSCHQRCSLPHSLLLTAS